VFPDGQRVVSGSYGELKVWDVETGECVATLEGQRVAVSPDGRCIYSGGSNDGTLKYWGLPEL